MRIRWGDRKKCSCYKREMQGILRVMELSVLSLTVDTKIFRSVQPLSREWSLWPMEFSMPGLPVHNQFPEITQPHVHGISDAIQPSHPLSSPSPPDFNLSQNQELFKWASSSHQAAKLSGVSASKQSFQWIFRTDFLYYWLVGLLADQGIIKSLLQHHSSKTSILLYSAFFIVQVSHLYMITGKNHSFD